MRRDEERMKRIELPAGRPVPSWSWFSKEGPIRYMELKFKEIDWATSADFETPFSGQLATEQERSSGLGLGGGLMNLRGLARKMRMTTKDKLRYIVFDEEGDFEVDDLRCVIIGRDKDKSEEENLKCHVLVIQYVKRVLEVEVDIYERVGVASLRPVYIEGRGVWVNIM